MVSYIYAKFPLTGLSWLRVYEFSCHPLLLEPFTAAAAQRIQHSLNFCYYSHRSSARASMELLAATGNTHAHVDTVHKYIRRVMMYTTHSTFQPGASVNSWGLV